MQVYMWCHPTYGILTGCRVVAEVVFPYPALCFVGQSSAGLPHIHSCHPPTSNHSPTSPQYHPPSSLQQLQCPYKGNHASVFTPRYTRNTSGEIFKIQNSYCDLRVFRTFLRSASLDRSVCDLPLCCVHVHDCLLTRTTEN